MVFRAIILIVVSLNFFSAPDAAVFTVTTSDEFLNRLDDVGPGDTILVQPGVYVDNTAHSSHAAFNPRRSGTADDPIVIKSAALHAATLKGSADTRPALGIHQRDHIVVDGFRVEGAIGFRERANHGILRNCDISGGYIQGGDKSLHWGAYIQTSENCLIENNHVHDMAPIGDRQHNGACIMVFGAQNNCIQNNTADGGNYMFSAFGQKSGPVADNIWRRNIARNAKLGFLGMGSTDGTRFSDRNVYYENIAINVNCFIGLDHNCRDFKVYNNTAYAVRTFFYGGYNAAEKRNSGMEVWNNIACAGMYRQNQSTPSPWTDLLAFSDANVIPGPACSWQDGAQSLPLNGWRRRTGLDARSLSDAPLFVDAANGDFHLRNQSPLIHKGLIRGMRSPGYDGQPPDIGAYPRNNDGTLIGHDWTVTEIGDDQPTLFRGAPDEATHVAQATAPAENEKPAMAVLTKQNKLALTLQANHAFVTARLIDMRGRTVAEWKLADYGHNGNYQLPMTGRVSTRACAHLLCELSGGHDRKVVKLTTLR